MIALALYVEKKMILTGHKASLQSRYRSTKIKQRPLRKMLWIFDVQQIQMDLVGCFPLPKHLAHALKDETLVNMF